MIPDAHRPKHRRRPAPAARWRALGLAIATVLPLAACTSSPIANVTRMKAERVPEALESSQAVTIESATDKELVRVVADMLGANKAVGLETATRVAVRTTLERAADEFATRGEDAPALEDLALTELPARIAVQAGIRAARIYYDDGERMDAFKLIRKIDQRYPSHGLRGDAGDLLSEIGDSFKNDKRRKLFLFPYSSNAPQIYEYLSTEYPTHPMSDDALQTLATIYEDKRRFDIAIERHRDLVLWAPDSPYRIDSEAAIPRLRLADLDGPEYGRDSMMVALAELEAWLRAYPDEVGRAEVERTLVDCLQRLADNDMGVARFYRTVLSVTGARQHAARALEYAKRAGNEDQLGEIRGFLAALDEIEELGAPRELPEAQSPDDLLRGGTNFDGQGPADLAPGSSEIAPRRTPRATEKEIEKGTENTPSDPTLDGPLPGEEKGGGQ
ncbi:MAG: hypothetical protein AAGB93_23535 [Planctomycetota bacterium]